MENTLIPSLIVSLAAQAIVDGASAIELETLSELKPCGPYYGKANYRIRRKEAWSGWSEQWFQYVGMVPVEHLT